MDDNKFIYESGDLSNSNNQLDAEYSELNSSTNDFQYTDAPVQHHDEDNRKKWFIIAIIFFIILLLSAILAFTYANKKKYDNWLQKIIEAARTHVNSDETVQSEIMLGNLDKITIDTLINDGHLANVDLINPRTKKSISLCNYVMISVDNDAIRYTKVTTDLKCKATEAETKKPTITLLGDAVMYIAKGSTFTDPGATAADIDGSDISSNITVNNTVDVNLPAEYSVTYSITNSKGVEAEPVIRYVIVEDKKAQIITPPTTKPSTGGTSTKPPTIIYVDKTNPTISLHGITGGKKIVAPNTAVTYSIYYADNVRLKKIVWCINSSCSSQSVSSKTYTKTISYTPKTLGTYQIKASAVDTSGNTKALATIGSIVATDTTITDTVKPTVSVSGVPTKTIAVGDQFNYAFTFGDNVSLKSIQYCVGENNCVSPVITVSGTSKVMTGVFKATAKGTYYFRAGATDAKGNVTTMSTIASVTVGDPQVDFSAPIATLVGPVPDQVAPGTPIEARVRIEDDIQLKSYNVCIGTVCKSGDVSSLNAKWIEVPISATMSTTGNYDITVNAADMTNKTLTKVIKTVKVVKMTETIPTVSVVSVSPSSPQVGDSVTVTLKINDDTGIAYYNATLLNQTKIEYLTNIKEKIITFNVKLTQPGTYPLYFAAVSTSGGEFRNKIIRNIVVSNETATISTPTTPAAPTDETATVIKACKTYVGTASYCVEKSSVIKAGEATAIKVTITDSAGINYYNSSLSGVPTNVGQKVLNNVNQNEVVINYNVTFSTPNATGYPLYLAINGVSGNLTNSIVDYIKVS